MTIKTYTAGRRLQIGDSWREPGEPVPEAHAWMRRDDWLHTGYLKEVELSEKDFRATVKKYLTDTTDTVLELAGLNTDTVLEGPHGTPRRYPVALKGDKAKAK